MAEEQLCPLEIGTQVAEIFLRSHNLPWALRDDFVSAASEGAMLAERNYDAGMGASEKTWARKRAYWACCEHMKYATRKKRNFLPLPLVDGEFLPSTEPDHVQAIESRDEREWVLRNARYVADKLGKRYRACLELRLSGRKLHECGAALGVTLNRARQMLDKIAAVTQSYLFD